MRTRTTAVLVVTTALLAGCGGDDSGERTAVSAAPGPTTAGYARALGRYCTGVTDAGRRAERDLARARTLAATDRDAAFAAVKRAQLRALSTVGRETATFARAGAPSTYRRFAAALQDDATELAHQVRFAKRLVRAAVDPADLDAVELDALDAGATAEFPEDLVERAPSCSELLGASSGGARASDAAAKSAARNAVSLVESCFADAGDYADCTAPDALGGGVRVVERSPAAGEVAVGRATATGYRVLAPSSSGNRFAITRRGGELIRSCSTAEATGGCDGGRW